MINTRPLDLLHQGKLGGGYVLSATKKLHLQTPVFSQLSGLFKAFLDIFDGPG